MGILSSLELLTCHERTLTLKYFTDLLSAKHFSKTLDHRSHAFPFKSFLFGLPGVTVHLRYYIEDQMSTKSITASGFNSCIAQGPFVNYNYGFCLEVHPDFYLFQKVIIAMIPQ